MSIKDLFDKGHSLKFVKNKTQDDIREDLESPRYVEAYSEKRARFVPNVDFTTASNFARFGLAEEYYDQAIKRIYQTYPYDGSQAEKIEWENDSTYLDLFLFENEYPRTNGHVAFAADGWGTLVQTFDGYGAPATASYEYISINGGPNADPNADYKSTLRAGPDGTGVSKANIYKVSENRDSNLLIDGEKGNTTEFWMKKAAFATSNTGKEVIFDAHTPNSTSGSTSYGRLTIELTGTISTTPFMLTYMSGASGISRTPLGVATITTSSVADDNWHHYAVSVKNNGTTDLTVKTYVDGVHIETLNTGSVVNYVSGTINANIAALVAAPSGSIGPSVGYGKLSASIDEFRFWKSERDAQQVGRYYRDQIGGGTNTDNIKYDDITNKVDLGVYFKFNEGITGDSTTDATILDYSGRISNGTFTGHDTYSRSTGSAIVLSNAATKEFKDPIIYSNHPDVSALATRYQLSGSAHDHENAVSIYKSDPGWILEEDEKESNHLKQLTQILASYFDDLYLQIEKLPRLKDINYPDETNYEKPLPFAARLLSSRGYDAPELFAHASALAKYLERDERKLFEKKLYEVKNIIYQNIYNNLSYIQKSKGTYKSLRNFLRCFGIDEELVKLNVYASDDVYEFKDNFTNATVRKKYIDFDDLKTRLVASEVPTKAYTATAYQFTSSTDSNSISYFPAYSLNSPQLPSVTFEAEVVFPNRSIKGDDNYDGFPSLTSSIFGAEHVVASNTDMSYASSNVGHFNVVAFKPDNDKRNVKFAIVTSSGGGGTVFNNSAGTLTTSNSYKGVYNNEKWNLAFRIAPTKAIKDGNVIQDIKHADNIIIPTATAYTYELYGVNYISNILQDEFTISGTMSYTQATNFFGTPLRFFTGAKRTNFTGSVERYSDVKVSSCRVWHDYIPNDAIRAHAIDASNYGVLHPYDNINDKLRSRQPAMTSLALHWGMGNVTGSDASGRFLIEDLASGSIDSSFKFGDDWTRDRTNYNYSGRGDFFTTNTNFSDRVVNVDYLQTAKQKLPEVVNSDDMVKILNKQDDVVFTRDTTYVQHLLSVEKSMYQIISEEMLRIFATIVDFNNLVGEPVNRYRPHYKKMEKLRELYFERIENDTLDLEKFTEYFKWVDDAVSIMIAQLIPVSSNAVELLRNMVESHILERNKYWTKFPTLETKPHQPISSLKGIEELKYNWKYGHAPLNPNEDTNQNENCLWWRQRAERTGPLATGDSNVDGNKQTLLRLITTEVTGAGPILKDSDGMKYKGTPYYNKSLARPVDLVPHKLLSLKGGSNPDNNNIHDFYKSAIKWGSDDDFIYLDIDNRIQETVCDDKEIPPELDKKEFRMKALTMVAGQTTKSNASGSGANDQQYTDAKSSLLLPFNMYSSSINTGYMSLWSDQFGVNVTNAHDDKYGIHAEVPIQGPFTEKYVGGSQHRHVTLNQGSDTCLTRPEGWHLQEFLNQTVVDYSLFEAFVNATTTATTDVGILSIPLGPNDDQAGEANEPSPYEYWNNGAGADHPWTFLKGHTPTIGTGPGGGTHMLRNHAYCEVLPSTVGQTFGLQTPLIDLLDVNPGSDVRLRFNYHMHGINIGTLRVQASQHPDFATGVYNLHVISGQQHANASDSYTSKIIGSIDNGLQLANWLGKRFYIRFLYVATAGHLGDCSIAHVSVLKSNASAPGALQNSLKLLNPTYDSHHRPSAIRMRDEYAKRPVNIRNIEMSGASSTKAGNYLDRYEYVNVMSEQNDPWFVTNASSLTQTTAMSLPGNYEIFHQIGRITVTTDTANTVDGDKFTLTTADGVSVSYHWDDDSPGSGNNTGDINSGFTIAQVNGLSAAADFAQQMKLALESPNGHGARLKVTRAGAVLEVFQRNASNASWEPIIIGAQGHTLSTTFAASSVYKDTFLTPDRTYIADTTRNRTRFVNRFSSPGGYEVMSRGFLDPAHETYSVYNAMTYRNLRVRQIYNTQLQAHCGRFGVSAHDTTAARVYGSEALGAIQETNYLISGDASRHKHHRNNAERIEFTGEESTSKSATFVTASVFDNAFVSHMIPRTDQQTRWITASII